MDNIRQTTCDLVMESEIFSHSCEVDWEINSFSKHKRDITSCEFSPVENCGTKWHLFIHFSQDEMEVGVKLLTEDAKLILPSLHITIQNSRGEIYEEKCHPGTETPWSATMKRPRRKETVSSPLAENGLFQLLDDDILLVHAAIRMKGCCYINKLISCKVEGKDVLVDETSNGTKAAVTSRKSEEGFVLV